MKSADEKKQEQFFKNFGEKVRRLRLEKHLVLEDMQQYLFSPQHFQKIECGKKAVNLFTAYRIAEAFEVELDDLISCCTSKVRPK